jgi:hypothetical protein
MNKDWTVKSVLVFWAITPCGLIGKTPMFQRNILPPSSGHTMLLNSVTHKNGLGVNKEKRQSLSVPHMTGGRPVCMSTWCTFTVNITMIK